MRSVFIIVLAVCSCAVLRADYSYQRRIQITGYGAVSTVNLIKGNRMALIAKGHTTVIDIAAETITEIEFSKKTYSVLPFAQMKKFLEDAGARTTQETSFKVTARNPGQSKVFGILNVSETIISIVGAGSSENIAVDSWIGTVPGYEQMVDFNRRLADKMGYAFASGMALLALGAPQTWQGFGEAAKELNRAPGAPFLTTIKIAGSDGTSAEATIRLDDFGGGIQDATRFDPPAGFKKVDAVLPTLPK
jgi:hypothetical protein